MIILIVGLVLLAGIFNPWTGLFSFYSSETEPEQPDVEHKSFRMTKGY